MLFKPHHSLPQTLDVPDTVPLGDFLFDEKYGRRPLAESLDSYVCGISGFKVSAREQKQRVDLLSRALAHDLGWEVNQDSELDKVVGIFASNNVGWPASPSSET